MTEFFAKLAEVLGVSDDEVRDDSRLETFDEWDSLGTLVVVSMIQDDYDVNIQSEELAEVETARQLWELIQNKREKGDGK